MSTASPEYTVEIDHHRNDLRRKDRQLARLQADVMSTIMRITALEVIAEFPSAAVLLAENDIGSFSYDLFDADGTEFVDIDSIDDISLEEADRRCPELWVDYLVSDGQTVGYAFDGALVWPEDLSVDDDHWVTSARLSISKMIQEDRYGPPNDHDKED